MSDFSTWVRKGLAADYATFTDQDLIEQLHYYDLPERDTPDGDNWATLEREARKRWGQDWLEKAFPS